MYMRNSKIIRFFLMLLLSTVLSLSVILTVNAADEINTLQTQSVNIKINLIFNFFLRNQV